MNPLDLLQFLEGLLPFLRLFPASKTIAMIERIAESGIPAVEALIQKIKDIYSQDVELSVEEIEQLLADVSLPDSPVAEEPPTQ